MPFQTLFNSGLLKSIELYHLIIIPKWFDSKFFLKWILWFILSVRDILINMISIIQRIVFYV